MLGSTSFSGRTSSQAPPSASSSAHLTPLHLLPWTLDCVAGVVVCFAGLLAPQDAWSLVTLVGQMLRPCSYSAPCPFLVVSVAWTRLHLRHSLLRSSAMLPVCQAPGHLAHMPSLVLAAFEIPTLQGLVFQLALSHVTAGCEQMLRLLAIEVLLVAL